MQTGIIFDIKRYAIHDGPGIRTTVFLKGCPLTCWWCHNPEGIDYEQQLIWRNERCLGCRSCAEACTRAAISFTTEGLLLDKSHCNLCGDCVEVCHAQALELISKKMTVTQVIAEIEKDVPFYDESGGGVTFSGGEPLMQPEFLYELLKACKDKEIHTAVDTSGYASSDIIARISEHVDLFLYDLKIMDEEKHRKFTGVSNKHILNNLELLSQLGKKVILRFPLIPGINDDEENIRKLGAFVALLDNVNEMHILPYHQTGIEKFKRLYRTKEPFISQKPLADDVKVIEQKLKSVGLTIHIGG